LIIQWDTDIENVLTRTYYMNDTDETEIEIILKDIILCNLSLIGR